MASKLRKPLIAGNWKMHNTLKESFELVTVLRKSVQNETKSEILVAPSFTALSVVCELAKGSPVLVAAQDMHWEEKGAFTGAVSPLQIKDAGCTHVIIGHSERRSIFGDTDEIVNKKLKAALKAGLIPILCIGETLDEREANKTYRVLETQVANGLKDFKPEELSSLIIAYEPVWAIGTGKTATPEQAQDAHLYIRRQLEKLYGHAFAEKTRILYGGSVKADNIDYLMAQPDLDGALVGGASLKADGFLRIINYQGVLAKN